MCLICGSPEGEPHFGGISCRACAAFFRRYFHSKKLSKKCTCKERTIKSHPCRKCRVEKCLKIGMTPERIQGGRDRNIVDHLQMIPSGSCSPSSPPSLLTARIISRATSNLEFAYPNWKQFNRMRREVGGITYNMNIYDLTSLTKIDIELTWNMVITMFPSTRKLEESDKAALLRNFHMKFWMIVPIFDCIENSEFYENMKEEEYKNMMVEFYDGSFEKGKELTKKEIVRIFEPYWSSFYTKTVPPIVGLNLEKEELMAILWLLFFDNGFINISSECLETCRNIRKMILRDLKNYQTDRNYDEMRFFDTVETLDIIERGEQKFMEELLVCEMHNVRIHDDFKAILKENKY